MNRLRQIRDEKGLRREDIAVRAGISYQYVSRLESTDPPTPGLTIARLIAQALDATLDEVFPSSVPDLVGRAS